MEKCYIVGYGIVDALGNNLTDCFESMLDNENYAEEIPTLKNNCETYCGAVTHENNLIYPDNFRPKILKNLIQAQKFALHATNQAIVHSQLPHSSNVAVLFSASTSNWENMEYYAGKILQNERLNPFKGINIIPDMIAHMICQHYKFMGASFSLAASCATSLYTIDVAMRLANEYDYVIVGSADKGTDPGVVKYFTALNATANVSKPFDDDRKGFLPADGSACIIIQTKSKVEKFNSTVYATLYPPGCATDGFDLTNPAPDGRGFKQAIEKALVGMDETDIDAISAHATSTPAGDKIEYDILAEHFPNTPIYAPKSKIGHSLGTTGLLELLYAIESMKKGILPHIHNLQSCNFDTKKLLVTKNQDISTNKKTLRTLNNSFAFGGKCVSQIVEVNK